MAKRSYAEQIVENMLEANGEPPPKLTPMFKMGDVVENKEGLKGKVYTTEKAEALIQADSNFSRVWAERFGREYVFGIEWFDNEDFSLVHQDELTLCVKDSSRCDGCKFRFRCWTE